MFGQGPLSYRRTAVVGAVANRFVVSVNMFNGSYTIANASSSDGTARKVTCLQTIVATGTDTSGTVLITGTDAYGQVQTETITPVGGSTVTSTKAFQTVTSLVGSGWIIAGGNDTIVFGTDALALVGIGGRGGMLHSIVIGATSANAITVADDIGTIAVLKASIAEQTDLRYDCSFSGLLRVTVTGSPTFTVLYDL